MSFSAPTPAVAPTASGGTNYGTQATQAMRQQPWFAQLMAQWGHPSVLSEAQKTELLARARHDPAVNRYAVVTSQDSEITDDGNIQPKGHFLRDALIAGGAVAAPIIGPALGGAISGGSKVANAASGGAGQKNVPNYNPNEPGTGPYMPDGSGGSAGSGKGPAAALALLGGLLGGKMLGNRDAQSNVPPQLSQLLQMGVDRQAAQTPLFNAANSGMHQMLPNFARQGSGSPTMLGSQAPAPQTMQVTGHTPDGGGMPSWLVPLMLGGGLAIPDLIKGHMPYASIIEGFKKLMKGGGSNNPESVSDYMNRRQGELGLGRDAGTGPDAPGAFPYPNTPTDDEGAY